MLLVLHHSDRLLTSFRTLRHEVVLFRFLSRMLRDIEKVFTMEETFDKL